MAQAIDAEELAARVSSLIERSDGGDVARAARRIGVREHALHAIVSAECAEPSVHMLSAIVRGFDVDAWWLISGDASLAGEHQLPVERRVDTLNLLSELGAALTMQRRSHLLRTPADLSDGDRRV